MVGPLLLDLAVFVLWLVLVFATFTNADAQTPPMITHMKLSAAATHVLDSLANDARTNRVENAACMTSYAVRDSTLEIETLSPANYLKADSTHIWAHRFMDPDDTTNFLAAPICGQGVPSLHSHVSNGGMQPPSQTDRETAIARGIWNLLLSVLENGYVLHIY